MKGRTNIAFIALTVALGGFLLGFDATVISGVVPFIREYFGLSGPSGDLRLGWSVSSLGWGALVGNAVAGALSDRYGRRRVLQAAALLFMASGVLAATATHFAGFVAARLIGGLAVGGAILIAPVYIAEIAPAARRGSLVSLNQLMIVIGISASFFSNYALLGLDHNWRWMLGVLAIPALLYFLLLLLVPESPRWLLLQGRDTEARQVLAAVQGEARAQASMLEIRESLVKNTATRGFRGLAEPRLRRVMLIAFGLAFFQQITGINAIFYYLPTIFAQAGGGLSDAFRQAVIVGVVNVGMTIVAIWLVDRLGRRPLLITGVAGMAISLLTISWAFSQGTPSAAPGLDAAAATAGVPAHIVLYAIIGFVASFAISLGPIMWVLLSEIFPNEQRAAAISVVGFFNALTSALVTFLFPWALSTLGSSGTFLFYGLMASAALLFVIVLVPETRGRTLEELESQLVAPPLTIPMTSVADVARRFPRDFLWGVATSAYQIEGAAREDGKGPSIWDEFCRVPGAIADASNGDVACDHYHRLEQDLDLIASLGVQAYRFSISWPRVQPEGAGAVNEAGLAFYERLIDGLLARGVQPYATLYHWDLPAALQRRSGGWYSRDTVHRFADYAQLIATRFGDRVVSFATHNEPWVAAVLGHERGIFAPGLRDRRTACQVSHHLLLSHALASQAIRASGTKASVGIVLNMAPVYPETDSDLDAAHAELEDGRLVRWYMDALFKGSYPADVLADLGADAPRMEPGDAALIAGPCDFLGVNYYHPIVKSAQDHGRPASSGAASLTDMGWEVAPHALAELLLRLHRDYALPPLLITENGAAYQDEVVGERIVDEARRHYIEAHLLAVAEAIEQGVDVRGYFVWSLLDNFEWAEGYRKRFGIVHVDYATQRRTKKSSALWYQSLLALASSP